MQQQRRQQSRDQARRTTRQHGQFANGLEQATGREPPTSTSARCRD